MSLSRGGRHPGWGLSRGGKIYCYLYDSHGCLDQQFLPFGICIISFTGVGLDTVCFTVCPTCVPNLIKLSGGRKHFGFFLVDFVSNNHVVII